MDRHPIDPRRNPAPLEGGAALPPPPPAAPAPQALHRELSQPARPHAQVPPAPASDIPLHKQTLRSGDLRRGPSRPGHGFNGSKRYDEIHRFTQPAQAPSFKPFPASVAQPVVDLLTMNGERTPYSHQAEVAHEILDEGRNVSLRTPTASGKTVSFLAPTLTLLHNNPNDVALMVYPVNALAADQYKNLVDLGFKPVEGVPGLATMQVGERTVVVGVMDGDTPENARTAIRRSANMILTNPVALHKTMLANANHAYRDGTSWNRVLSNIRIVVLDEAHLQNGVGGTHTALVFRRLQAITEARSGRSFQVILASATIGNPTEHAEALTGQGNWASVDRSGAKTQERTVVVLNPAEHPSGDGRWSPTVIIEDLAMKEYLGGRPTLIFCPSRDGTGRIADRINDAAGKDDVCMAFHSGLPPAIKRQATARVLRGEVPIVAATSALEVGVDIGTMQTCILNGHPGDNASYSQRIGRVGRTTPGKVYLVLDENQNAVNSYLAVNPSALNGAPEARTVYPENKNLALKHAACAYIETRKPDLVAQLFPKLEMREIVAMSLTNPHAGINMLGGLGEFGQFIAYGPDGKEIQKLSGQDALLNWHQGAVIRSSFGKSYVVTGIELGTMRVTTEAMPPDVLRIYTNPKKTRTIQVTNPEPVGIPGLEGIRNAFSGDFDVSQQTTAYRQLVFPKGANKPIKTDIDLAPEQMNPAIAFDTRGVELVMGRENPIADALLGLGSGIGKESEKFYDALGDVMRKTLPLVVQARPEDVDLDVRRDGEDQVRFIFFDMADGGMGWSETAAHRFREWLEAAGTLLKRCSCKHQGCPKCTLAGITPLDRRDLADSVLLAAGR